MNENRLVKSVISIPLFSNYKKLEKNSIVEDRFTYRLQGCTCDTGCSPRLYKTMGNFSSFYTFCRMYNAPLLLVLLNNPTNTLVLQTQRKSGVPRRLFFTALQ